MQDVQEENTAQRDGRDVRCSPEQSVDRKLEMRRLPAASQHTTTCRSMPSAAVNVTSAPLRAGRGGGARKRSGEPGVTLIALSCLFIAPPPHGPCRRRSGPVGLQPDPIRDELQTKRRRRHNPTRGRHSPSFWIQSDGPRLVQLLPEQDLPQRAVQLRHLDPIGL